MTDTTYVDFEGNIVVKSNSFNSIFYFYANRVFYISVGDPNYLNWYDVHSIRPATGLVYLDMIGPNRILVESYADIIHLEKARTNCAEHSYSPEDLEFLHAFIDYIEYR